MKAVTSVITGYSGTSVKSVVFVSLVPFTQIMKTTTVHFDTQYVIVAVALLL